MANSIRQRLADAALSRLLRQGPAANDYVPATVRTPMREQDPPPELRTAVVHVGPHDFREAVFGTGAFTLGDFLGWSDMIARQEDGGLPRRLLNSVSAGRRLRPALRGVPLPEAAGPVLRGRAPWYRDWLSHPAGDDPWWRPYRAGKALTTVNTPVLIISGWQDLFLDQSLHQYETLRARNVDVALTVGPWTHLQLGLQGAMTLARESLAWLDEHLADDPVRRRSPVRAYRTGERRWHELAAWPPPSAPAVFQLHANRTLTLSANPAPADAEPPSRVSAGPAPDGLAPGAGETVSFWYDPADPTPAVGGRTLSGVKDNRALEARADVVTFTTDPLPTAVDMIGKPVLELSVSVEPKHADFFVRLCDVDKRGRSRNFADAMLRLDPSTPAGRVQRLVLTLDPCFHRLAAGHRLRLQISGGSFPRFARNLGTPGGPAEAHDLRPQRHIVHCAESRLVLPVAATN